MSMKKIFWFLIPVCFASCGEKYDCPNASLIMTYKGYLPSEIDSLTLKTYAKGSNFSMLLDSVVFTRLNGYYNTHGDTTEISMFNYLNGSKDFRVYNPFDNRIVSISNIVHTVRETKSGGLFSMDPGQCVSPVSSYNRDGNIVYPSGFYAHNVFVQR
jgi:hypothetical protein